VVVVAATVVAVVVLVVVLLVVVLLVVLGIGVLVEVENAGPLAVVALSAADDPWADGAELALAHADIAKHAPTSRHQARVTIVAAS
jgi:hypothetical protein